VAFAAAALVMRKRKQAIISKEQLLGEPSSMTSNSLMRKVGIWSAAAGANMAAAVGFKMQTKRRRTTGSGRSVTSTGDLSGSVSRRLRSMETGDDESAPYYREDEIPPMFINVPADGTYVPDPTLVEHSASVEVEGPYRPSSYSACV
jgi:hypothetical protein